MKESPIKIGMLPVSPRQFSIIINTCPANRSEVAGKWGARLVGIFYIVLGILLIARPATSALGPGTALMIGASVSVSGLIGFVGLIVPHLVRTLAGPDHRLLLPASALGGAAFLVLADTVARTVVAPGEMPVGVVTALVGGPFFLFLFLRHLRER